MKRKIALTILFSLLATNAYAAPAVKMIGLKPTTLIELSQNPNDQVAALISSPTTLAIVGTSDGDGFITGYDRTATSVMWSLRLGGPEDDVALAAVRDSQGNYWIVGASAVPRDPQGTTSIPQETLNPGGVIPDAPTIYSQLKQLDIWKVSSDGQLISTNSLVMSDSIYPTTISINSGKVSVRGSIASHSLDQFNVNLSSNGVFSQPIISSAKNSNNSALKEVKTNLSVWKSFTTSVAIKGLPLWKPKPNSHVLIRYDAKTKNVAAAYLAPGEILDVAWEKSIGIIALINYSQGYGLTVIK